MNDFWVRAIVVAALAAVLAWAVLGFDHLLHGFLP